MAARGTPGRCIHEVTHMANLSRVLPLCGLVGLLAFDAAQATAATYWWNTADGLWTNSSNWSNAASGGTTGTVPANSTADVAIFNQTAVNGNEIISLVTSSTIGSIQVNNTGSTTFRSDSATSRTLTLGAGGLTINAGAGPVTIGDATNPVRIGQASSNSITNNSSSLLTIVNGANVTATVFSFGGSGNIDISQGSLTGSGIFAKAGSGTVTLSSSNSYTGITRLDSGVLNVTSIKSVGGGNSSLGAPVTAASGTITFQGSATLLYTGTGDTTDRGVASNSLAPSGSVFTIDQSGSGLLKFTADFISGYGGAANGLVATLAFRGSSGGAGEYAGVIKDSATAGKFTSVSKAGTGTWTLSGANTYSGTTGISGGVLALAGSGQLGASGSSAVTLSGGALDLGNTSQTVASVTISAGAASGDTIYGGTLSGTAFTVNFASGSAAVSATLAGTGRLTKTGTAGVLALTGSNSYSGGTVISSGTVIVSNADALGTGAVAVASSSTAATLRLSSVTATAYALTGSANGIIASAAGASVLRVDNTGTSTTFAGGIQDGSGTMGLTLVGNGQLTLSAANTYTGVTTISGGTLALGSAGTLANSGTVVVGSTGFGGSVLNLTAKTGTYTFGSSQTVAGIGTINFGAGKTVASQGVWAPGNSIGSNAVTGNLTLSGTSQFELGTPGTSLTSTGSSDFTAVSGTLTLGGNLTLLDNAGADSQGSYGAGSYRLFTAPTLSGTFASVTAPVGATTTRVGMVYTAGTSSGQGVFANVYNLATASNAQTVNLGNVHVGDTATKAVSLANTAPFNATYTETLGSGGFSSTSAGYTATGSVTGIAGGSSGTGSLVVGFTTGSAGARNGSTVLALNSEAVNSSGLGTTAAGSQTITITGTVWNYAAVNTISGSYNLGTVLKGTPLSHTLSITNTAANDGYSERLGASFGPSTGQASGSGSWSLLSAGGTSTALSVYLASGSAGSASGSQTVNFTSDGDGTSGLGTSTLGSETVNLTATILDPALASFASGSTATTSLLIDFGTVNQNSSVSPLGFSLYNLLQTSDYTADLALLNILSGTGNTGAITTTLPETFNNLGAGNSFGYTASLSTANLGAFSNVYTLQFKSANNGTVYSSDTQQTLTLTVQGVIGVPEPSAVALAGIGVGVAGWVAARRGYRRKHG
jgi:fibronectin-binding autotransporter adhesin